MSDLLDPPETLSEVPVSSTQVLARIGLAHQIRIDWTGQITKIIPRLAYRTYAIKLAALILIGVIARMIKQYPYHPITVLGNTIYAQTIIETLASDQLDFAVCAGGNRIGYYETTDGNEIAFEGYSPQAFDSIQPQPLPPADLMELRRHTGLKIIQRPQMRSPVLRSQPKRYGRVLAIKKFVGNLYYVSTGTHRWITRRVLTDGVHPLCPGEIISSLVQSSIKEEPVRRDLYQVESNLSISPVGPPPEAESLIYSLKVPRHFRTSDIIIIHPFHLPASADPIASLIEVTLSLASELGFKP